MEFYKNIIIINSQRKHKNNNIITKILNYMIHGEPPVEASYYFGNN